MSFLPLFLCLCALSCLDIGFHQSLVSFLFQSCLVKLSIRDVQQRERHFLRWFFILFNPQVLIPRPSNRLLEISNQSIQLCFVLQILSFQDTSHLFLRLGSKTLL